MNNIIFEGLVYFSEDYYYYSDIETFRVECAKSGSIRYVIVKEFYSSINIEIKETNPGRCMFCSYNSFVWSFHSDYRNLLKKYGMVEIKNE